MSELLEKSLDDIIGDRPARSGRQNGGRGRGRERERGRPQRDSYRPPRNHRPTSHGIPEEIAAMAGDKPLLRVKNIHSELNGRDLSELFGLISPVEFVKFDPQRETVAYVLFENDQKKNNNLAVEKFDGRQAMRRTLIVENTTLLADRIVASENERGALNIPIGDAETPRTRERQRGRRRDRSAKKAAGAAGIVKPKNKPPTVDDLDEQLNAYMNNREQPATEQQQAPVADHQQLQENMAVD